MQWRRIKLDAIANVALVAACASICYAVYTRPASAQRQEPDSFKPGEVISVQDVDLKRADSTLLMFVRSNCRFCTDSMPFYSQLTRALKAQPSRKAVNVIVVTTDDEETAVAYLAEHSVQVDTIVPRHSPPSKVWATPTLLLVSSDGRIKNAWTGRLPQAEEARVRGALGL